MKRSLEILISKLNYALHAAAAAATATTTPAASRPQLAATPSGPLAEAAAAPAAIPDQAPSGQSSLFSAEVAPAKPKPGVYARGRHTQEVATAQLAKVTGGTRSAMLLSVAAFWPDHTWHLWHHYRKGVAFENTNLGCFPAWSACMMPARALLFLVILAALHAAAFSVQL